MLQSILSLRSNMNKILKRMEDFRKDRRGITGIVIALVVAMVAIAIVIPIGMLLTANIYTTVSNMVLGTSGNATRTVLFNNIWSAYSLAAVVPIVAAAGLIISVVIAAFALRGPR
jgi:Flp pilus assembly pilin Flp